MDLEELSLRLGSLEQARADEIQKAAQQAFMDKYGSRISNNGNLGLVILNELNRRNIDTSAADEAVQEILDDLRMQATALLDAIKTDMNQATELIDKIDAIDESVQAAAEATGTDLSPTTEEVMTDAGAADAGEMMPAEGDMPPEEQMPAYDAGMAEGDVPPEEQATEETMIQEDVPQDDVMPPEQPLPPEQDVSDMRMKRIKQLVSDRRAKHVKKDVSAKPAGNVLDSNILAACRGGF